MATRNPSCCVIYQGAYPPNHSLTAGVRRVRDIARGLVHAGQDVSMLTPAHFEHGAAIDGDDFKIVHLGSRQTAPTAGSRRSFWSAVKSHCLQHHPDFVLFYNNTIDSVFAMKSLRRAKIRTSLEMCDQFSTAHTSIVWRFIFRCSERLLPRQTDVNFVISRHLQTWVRNVSPSTPAVILPGMVDLTQFHIDDAAGVDFRKRYAIPHDSILFVYSGSFWKHKGVATLLQGFQRATSHRTDIKLVITGSQQPSNLQDDIAGLIATQELESFVITPGLLKFPEFVGALSTANVAVSPSSDHPFSHAAFPTKVAEYAAMGRAILATSVGDIPLYFRDGENAVLCAADCPVAMETAILRLASDEGLRRRVAESARLTAKQHFDYRSAGTTICNAIRPTNAEFQLSST